MIEPVSEPQASEPIKTAPSLTGTSPTDTGDAHPRWEDGP